MSREANPYLDSFECPRCGHCCAEREWVSLTDGEIDILSCEMVKGDKSVNWLCKVLEAKLKEKNKW